MSNKKPNLFFILLIVFSCNKPFRRTELATTKSDLGMCFSHLFASRCPWKTESKLFQISPLHVRQSEFAGMALRTSTLDWRAMRPMQPCGRNTNEPAYNERLVHRKCAGKEAKTHWKLKGPLKAFLSRLIGVAERSKALDLSSCVGNHAWVRIPPPIYWTEFLFVLLVFFDSLHARHQ